MSDDTRETIPLTSPLAVLTTRTTQEHIMTTHSTTDLEPGDFVQHPVFGHGLVGGGKQILHLARDGFVYAAIDLTGWERVETCTADERRILNDFREVASGEAQEAVYPEAGVVIAPHDAFKQRPELVRPGHVQVRVNDLDLGRWEGVFEGGGWNHATRVAIRAANALAAQRAESTPPADEPEIVGDGCACWVTPEHTWTTYGSAVEPGSQSEYNPRCPKHGEKPTSATITLYCPDCGEAITNTAMVEVNREGERYLDFCNVNVHTCPPAQPDEPTLFGARIVVTDDLSGKAERWCRQHDEYWASENGALMTWAYLTQRGAVTLGWDE